MQTQVYGCHRNLYTHAMPTIQQCLRRPLKYSAMSERPMYYLWKEIPAALGTGDVFSDFFDTNDDHNCDSAPAYHVHAHIVRRNEKNSQQRKK